MTLPVSRNVLQLQLATSVAVHPPLYHDLQHRIFDFGIGTLALAQIGRKLICARRLTLQRTTYGGASPAPSGFEAPVPNRADFWDANLSPASVPVPRYDIFSLPPRFIFRLLTD